MILPAIPFETFSATRIKAKFHDGEDRPVKRGWNYAVTVKVLTLAVAASAHAEASERSVVRWIKT